MPCLGPSVGLLLSGGLPSGEGLAALGEGVARSSWPPSAASHATVALRASMDCNERSTCFCGRAATSCDGELRLGGLDETNSDASTPISARRLRN